MDTPDFDTRPGPDEPGIVSFISQTAQFFSDGVSTDDIGAIRAGYAALCRHFHPGRPATVRVRDDVLDGPAGKLRVRIYEPDGRTAGTGLIYLHGGGYILGDLDSHDDACCGISEKAGVRVMSVDYRLAPEHRFPAAFDDCLAASKHVFRHAASYGLDATRIAIGGDSAGGNLAAAVCLAMRDDGDACPCGQILVYPALGGDMSRGSYMVRSNAPGLTTEDMRTYDACYAGQAAQCDTPAKFRAPLAETDYSGLPPAFLVACEWDPLRDDCFAYARQLRRAGVNAEVRHERELVHGSLRARYVSPAAQAMFDAVAAAVRTFTS